MNDDDLVAGPEERRAAVKHDERSIRRPLAFESEAGLIEVRHSVAAGSSK